MKRVFLVVLMSVSAMVYADAVSVNVCVVQKEDVRMWKEFSGRTTAVNAVELRPQVSGTIQNIHFNDGEVVQEGELLVEIDPRPFQAALQQAKAEVQTAKNELLLAEKELARVKSLVEADAMPGRMYDEKINIHRVAKSRLDFARATLDKAKIDWDHAYLKAPISGRIGRVEVTKGNVVQAGPNAPVLTTIVANVSIYADFDMDEQTYLTYIRTTARDLKEEQKIPVRVSVPSDSQKILEGTIHTFDNRIDAGSGTIRARALLSNVDNVLLPGMFVKVLVGSPLVESKIMVPEASIGTDQNRRFVYVVDEKNTVTYREVTVGPALHGQKEIVSGLQGGERIVADNLTRVRPGVVIAPQVVS